MEARRTRFIAYGMAVLGPAISVLIRLPLWPVLGDAIPYTTFYPAITIAAYLGGFWPGLLATVLSAAASAYFILDPRFSFVIANRAHIIGLVLFVLTGTMISILCEALHRARRRIVVEERRRAEELLRETDERFRQLAQNIHEIFWIKDARDDQLVYISPNHEEIWGKAFEGVHDASRGALNHIHPDDRDAARLRNEQQRRGESTDAEFRLVGLDGSIRWVRGR